MSEVIVFQGDSITDCGRNREVPTSMGTGYAMLVKSMLGYENPGKYEFYNRGVSGNRIPDMYARIQGGTINLKPDYLSILIGVNDVWHGISSNNGVTPEKYEKLYNMFIEEIKAALPDIKIMIFEPFVMKGSATCDCYENPRRWSAFKEGVYANAEAARRVAEKHGLTFVPLQSVFDEACKLYDSAYWLRDGVHPLLPGHELIKREWIKAFNTIKR